VEPLLFIKVLYIFTDRRMSSTGSRTCRSFLDQVWYRVVGVRGAESIFPDPLSSSSIFNKDGLRDKRGDSDNNKLTTPYSLTSNFGHVPKDPAKEIARHKVVFLGEVHSMPPIISFQRQVQKEMYQQADQLHVILEHFSFDLQEILDQYLDDVIDFEGLQQMYHSMGEEGHDLEPYRGLLEDAKHHGIRLHAGFLPRKFARMLMKEGEERTVQAASKWLPENVDLKGSDFHYNVFESFLSGRSLYNPKHKHDDTDHVSVVEPPSDQFRSIFKAQVLKDEAMAHRIVQLMEQSSCNNTDADNSHMDQKFLVIAGNGHMKHYCGVPERVLRDAPNLSPSDTCLVISESTTSQALLLLHQEENSPDNHSQDASLTTYIQDRFGEGSNPADYMYFYEIPAELSEGWSAKDETKKVYDKVGDTANLPGNKLKAAWIMYHLGYTEKQFEAAGPDVYNFQGVGNPHLHAKIQPGETVLDLGSGLGIDSIIACHATGPNGLVVGIDLSEQETKHALKNARERGLNAHFMVGDMEDMKSKVPDNSIDVVISNGAFCLAPSKEKAFREVYRVLKPGGRFSVCTTTTKQDNLEPGVSWPLCMKMFIPLRELKPLCQKIGFEDIFIDDSNSQMSMDIPEEVWEESNPGRSKVHVGGKDFEHLKNYDMEKICARVCVVAKKPI
jgi:arsenite methyltransferase